ncbi:protein escargot-like [Tropilaelaps mercedesae]|uniref:Protein escargot-like n=1 Tax=Tropilaelaps mercedesae TaxID=418985 RepID=A0A1V9XG76_9ACAR|nr:protein escargot-like [Tropilaelaps mercedesae]
MTSLSGVKRPWLDEPVVLTPASEPVSEGPEDLSTNSERSSLSVSPSPSEAATVPELNSTPFDLSTKRGRLSSSSSEGGSPPTFRLPRTPAAPTTPIIPPLIAPLLDTSCWSPLLYPLPMHLPALYYSSLCANLTAQTFRPHVLTHDKPQDAVVPSWESRLTPRADPKNEAGEADVAEDTKSASSATNGPANRFTCEDCHKSYSTFAGLSKHKEFHCVNSAAGRKEFSCKYCPKSYVSLGALKMHVRTHTLPCKCDLCGKAFSRPWLLQGHIRTHTGEKPFECEHCHRAFADRSNLRAHLQTHQEVKKYSCSRCAKTFSRASLLHKHRDSGACAGSSVRTSEQTSPNSPAQDS